MLKPYTVPPKLSADAFAKAIQIRPETILTSNSKLSKDGIHNVTMPAARASVVIDGKLQVMNTCPSAGQCLNLCYASSGTYLFSASMVKHTRNLQFLLDDAFGFADQLITEISAKAKRNPKLKVRWNDSGDIFNDGYWGVMVAVMKALPHVTFYAYSKRVSFLKSKEWPENFTVVFSMGGTEDHLIDTNKDRHAAIFSSRAALRAAGYSDGTHTDRLASNRKFQKIGLVVHGNWLAMHKLRKVAGAMEATAKRKAFKAA